MAESPINKTEYYQLITLLHEIDLMDGNIEGEEDTLNDVKKTSLRKLLDQRVLENDRLRNTNSILSTYTSQSDLDDLFNQCKTAVSFYEEQNDNSKRMKAVLLSSLTGHFSDFKVSLKQPTSSESAVCSFAQELTQTLLDDDDEITHEEIQNVVNYLSFYGISEGQDYNPFQAFINLKQGKEAILVGARVYLFVSNEFMEEQINIWLQQSRDLQAPGSSCLAE